MIDIEKMTMNDIPFALSLTESEKWGYREDDFKRLIKLSPKGCFVARKEGQCCGIITSVCYDDFGFLGTLIIDEDYRGSGLGEALMRHTIGALEEQSVQYIELDGVFPAVSLYRRLGFRDKYLSLRFVRPAINDEEENIDAIDKDALQEEIFSFDRENTGIDRSGVLRSYIDESILCLTEKNHDVLSGFAVILAGQGNMVRIAPMVATNRKAASQLMSYISEKFRHTFVVAGVPEGNRDSIALLRQSGFIYRPPSLRMYRGKRRDYEGNIYTIASADKG